MKTSPRVLKATEKYIASLGRKREELTEEQWNLMVRYVKNRRIAIPFLLFSVIFCIGTTFAYWYQGHKYYTKVIPHQTVKISFDDQRESLSLSLEEIRRYLSNMADCYMMVGMSFLLAVLVLHIFIGSVTFTKMMNRKSHRILLSRPPLTGIVV